MPYISASNKLFDTRCFENAEEKKEKRKQKAENVMIHHATQKRRSTDISHRRRFTQIKVLYRRCFFFRKKK